jgi:hypothetical protein
MNSYLVYFSRYSTWHAYAKFDARIMAHYIWRFASRVLMQCTVRRQRAFYTLRSSCDLEIYPEYRAWHYDYTLDLICSLSPNFDVLVIFLDLTCCLCFGLDGKHGMRFCRMPWFAHSSTDSPFVAVPTTFGQETADRNLLVPEPH